MILIIFFTLFTVPLSYKTVTASNTNFVIKSFHLCNYTQGLFKYYGNITKEGEDYYTTGRLIIPVPMDENIGCTLKIESKVLNKYMEIFTIRENNLCKALNTYGGEFWYNLQRGAGVLVRTCPLPPGRYESHHVKLDFSNIALQTFPFGDLKFTGRAVNNKNPTLNMGCGEIEVYNNPN